MQQIADRIAVLSRVQSAHYCVVTATAFSVMLSDPIRQPADDSFSIRIFGLSCIVWRHLAQIQLIQDVLVINQRVLISNAAIQRIKPPIAFLLFRTMALAAVGSQERRNCFFE